MSTGISTTTHHIEKAWPNKTFRAGANVIQKPSKKKTELANVVIQQQPPYQATKKKK